MRKNYLYWENSPRYLYLWGVLTTTQIICLFRDGRRTDRQTDDRQTYLFSRLNFSEQGENSFILYFLIVKVWSSHVKIRV